VCLVAGNMLFPSVLYGGGRIIEVWALETRDCRVWPLEILDWGGGGMGPELAAPEYTRAF
jgi:hypothetical protein